MSRAERERSLEQILTFATELHHSISRAEGLLQKTNVEQLERQVLDFPPKLSSITATKRQQLDSSGTTLWNACVKVKRGSDKDSSKSSQKIEDEDLGNIERLMKAALRTAKYCIELRRLDLALKVLEKAAIYNDQLKNGLVRPICEESKISDSLTSEYYIIRTTLAWQQDQFDLAEHMFSNASVSISKLNPQTAENLADSLFEMGEQLLLRNKFELAVKWLERALEIFDCQNLEDLSSDASEIRLSIIQSLFKALLELERADALAKAEDLVCLLESEIGSKLIVNLMKLETLSSSVKEIFDSEQYSVVLLKMIRTVILSEANFKLVMHHIRKLHDKSPSLACDSLDQLLRTRMFQGDNLQWITEILINRLWMTINQRDSDSQVGELGNLLEAIASNVEDVIDLPGTHAAQTLLWKRIEENYALGRYDMAEAWCHLAQHRIFKHTGDLNKAKIERKLLLCTLERGDLVRVREIFGSMTENTQGDPLTRFLMYKFALRAGDGDLAGVCLEKIFETSREDATLLYACVLDAQQSGEKMLGIAALQLVLKKHESSTSPAIHIPALLRCAIRMVASYLETNKNDPSPEELRPMTDQLCRLFESAATHARKMPLAEPVEGSLFTIEELQWFSQNAYNLSLKHSGDWDPRSVLRMVGCCISFLDIYPTGRSDLNQIDLSLRRLFCDFTASILLIALARAGNNPEVHLQDYLVLRHHIRSFRTTFQTSLQDLDEAPRSDLLTKFSVLIAYDFEAAIKLKAWNGITDIVVQAQICKHAKLYELMADLVLCSEAPAEVVARVLKAIVNGAWSLDNFNMSKLARYMRCIFQYALSSKNDTVTYGLLDQVQAFARQATQSEICYPDEELEWIATMVFNRSVDLYCEGMDSLCEQWAAKSIDIAKLCQDGGILKSLLEQKMGEFDLNL